MLTAAHCVNGDPLGALVVFFRGTEPTRPVYGARVAARYSPDPGEMLPNAAPGVSLSDLSLDLAVLRLTEPVRDRRPVPLAADPRRVPKSLRIAGAGLSGSGRRAPAHRDPDASGGQQHRLDDRPRERCPDLLRRFRRSGRRAGSRRGTYVWGVASAVISRAAPCGGYVVIAPAAQVFSGSGTR